MGQNPRKTSRKPLSSWSLVRPHAQVCGHAGPTSLQALTCAILTAILLAPCAKITTFQTHEITKMPVKQKPGQITKIPLKHKITEMPPKHQTMSQHHRMVIKHFPTAYACLNWKYIAERLIDIALSLMTCLK